MKLHDLKPSPGAHRTGKRLGRGPGSGKGKTGGRGGKVIAVTNLNDSGPGSLRAAIDTEGPRIVVFRVAGIIELKSALNINHPDITIAGQSAPGDGVCIAHDSLNINTHNVILRHLRVHRTDVEDLLAGRGRAAGLPWRLCTLRR